ncbi:MAG TPA: HAMP domain-containing sensor histidine kinase [Dyella sp.]|uniref:HAMP domain-containing sensor histidine kinase n=1 Tax=Dyella sp. TaxID=1869338 RepID=UPI002BFF1A32|nr:HAMP domain-containing sensor histidine kinase [Dyella sp.]HUB89723.1 HAMP domain-containing sensor histidine kinase [Dyella sp.]
MNQTANAMTMPPDAQQAYANETAAPVRRALFDSLSSRLLATCLLALALSLAVVLTGIGYVFAHYPAEVFASEDIEGVAHRLAKSVQFDVQGRPMSLTITPDIQKFRSAFAQDTGYQVDDEFGNALLSSMPMIVSVPHEGDWMNTPRCRFESGGRIFYVETVPIPGARKPYFLQVVTSEAFDTALIRIKRGTMPKAVGISFLVAALVFGATMLVTLRRLVKPIRAVSQAAAGITPQNLTTRLSLQSIPSEMRPLVASFNDALARLEEGYLAQQTFLAAAAHELQTPLTLIRGEVELQPASPATHQILHDVDRMSRQVRQLLHLMEVSVLQSYEFSQIDLEHVVRDVATHLARSAAARRVTIETSLRAPGKQIRADEGGLFILLKNLLENALAFAPRGSTVAIMADASSISVRDEGPGIDEAHLPFIFSRFWRAPDNRAEGCGLGLAICKEIVLAHGWQLVAERTTPGTLFTIRFSKA